MSLPHGYEDPSDYLKECLEFFKKYQHLYNFPNTDLLINNVLEQIEIKDLEYIDVFEEKFDLKLVESDFLQNFFKNLKLLEVEYEKFENNDLELLINVPLSKKKKHEIAYLSNEIESLCKDVNCDTVVDFGSGLGYLDQQLFETTGFKVLGLECSETNYIGAKKRQNKYHSDSTDYVKYIKHTITGESCINITSYLEDKFPNCHSFCITGLHACADLTIDAINIFLKMDKAKALVIMPCCYHRIKGDDCRFENFPLSDTLKEIFIKYDGFEFLSVPFLRLATQPPNLAEEKLFDLVFNLLSRAVLQLYCYKHNWKLRRNKRKAIRLKSIENNFEVYLENVTAGFKIISNDENTPAEFNMEELHQIWSEITESTFKKTAIFILLQNYLQPIFENFVLYDRLLYLRENGINNCRFKKIINENISPRCLALLAEK